MYTQWTLHVAEHNKITFIFFQLNKASCQWNDMKPNSLNCKFMLNKKQIKNYCIIVNTCPPK